MSQPPCRREVRRRYVASRFRGSRDREGRLTFVGPHREQLALIADMAVEFVPEGSRTTVGALFGSF